MSKGNDPVTYASAGVDINNADRAKLEMKVALETSNPIVLNKVGAFSSLVSARFDGISDPVLVLKMEEPGSKQLLAAQHGRLSEIGFDLINHLLNDVIVMGARPLVVLDTIICGKLEKDKVVGLVKAMAQACREQGCELVGGETSEQPRVIPSGSYILSAAAVGVVDRARIIDGASIKSGHSVIALASNGVHTNGYTLVRTLLERSPELADSRVGDESFIDAVLKPHRCYNQLLQELFGKVEISGLAHITGGGMHDNLVRIVPNSVDAQIDLSKIEVLPVFKAIREAGSVVESDMLRTFNLGVGIIVVAPRTSVAQILDCSSRHNVAAYEIGEVASGTGKVNLTKALVW